MTKHQKKDRLPKTSEKLEALTSDAVIRRIFGAHAQTALKRQADESGNRVEEEPSASPETI